MKHELAVLVLWLIAAVVTLLVVEETGLYTYLGPLYFICMVGSIYVVRAAKRHGQ